MKSPEQYQPPEEETKKAEEMMTGEQKVASEEREATFQAGREHAFNGAEERGKKEEKSIEEIRHEKDIERFKKIDEESKKIHFEWLKEREKESFDEASPEIKPERLREEEKTRREKEDQDRISEIRGDLGLEEVDEKVQLSDSIVRELEKTEGSFAEDIEIAQKRIGGLELSRDNILRSQKERGIDRFNKNELSMVYHKIASSKLDILILSTGDASVETHDKIIEDFIDKQIIIKRNKELTTRADKMEKVIADYDARVSRTQNAIEKLEKEFSDIVAESKGSREKYDNLRGVRDDVRRDLYEVEENREGQEKELSKIEQLRQEYESLLQNIIEMEGLEINPEERPRKLADDPDFEACLEYAKYYTSDEVGSAKINSDPEEAVIKIFTREFPQKAAYYERLTEQ